MNKPILMIHEFKECYWSIPLQDYILSFDDGLYSPFLLLDRLLGLNTPLIFSISTNIICSEGDKQSEEVIGSNLAHKKAFNKNFENYLKWSQIKEIEKNSICAISGHGHNHINISSTHGLYMKISLIKADTEEMIKTFMGVLGYIPTTFCFPYNYENVVYRELMKRNYGFTHLLGKDRIDIDNIV